MADDDSSGSNGATFSEDDVATAVSAALSAKDVPLEDSDVKVSTDGLIHFMVRLSRSVKPLHQIPDDTSNLPPGTVEGAPLLLLGSVQTIEDSIRVSMRIVITETSEIVEVSKGDATGATVDALTDAAQLAIEGLPSLNQ